MNQYQDQDTRPTLVRPGPKNCQERKEVTDPAAPIVLLRDSVSFTNASPAIRTERRRSQKSEVAIRTSKETLTMLDNNQSSEEENRRLFTFHPFQTNLKKKRNTDQKDWL
jgi:hypothetical protein